LAVAETDREKCLRQFLPLRREAVYPEKADLMRNHLADSIFNPGVVRFMKQIDKENKMTGVYKFKFYIRPHKD